MKFYTHSTEADRIAAVNELQIIGSVNKQIFDDIALLASVICKAPIAFVGFIDSEIQWFKSITGIELKSIPREISFCTVMIQSGERLITENLEEHELLRHNPFVTGDLNLRSCISIPIKNKENLILGSVCAVDFLPRKFTSLEVDAMEALARQAAEHLDVRRGIIRQQKAAQIEQRILELQLIRTEFRLSSMLEKLPGIVLYETSIHKEILHDKEREYISNNIVGMLGYPIEKYIADVNFFVGLIHRDDFKIIDIEFQKWERSEYSGVLNLEFRCLHANGEYIWINDSAVCIKTDEDKNNWYLSGLLIDITQRKIYEEKLRETNSHLNALFNNSLQAFILLDKKLNILAFNRVAQIGSISFWGKDLVEGDCIIKILSKEYQQQYREFCDIAFSGKSHIVSEIELITYNGRKVWIEISFVPIVSENGEVTQICFSGLNITKRKTVQARLEKAEHNYRSIVQNAIIGIFQVLPTGEFLSVNKTMASMLGFDSPEELMESRDAMDNYVLPESRSEFIDLLNKHGHVSGFEFQGKKRNGEIVWFTQGARAVYEETSNTEKIAYYEGYSREITERKNAELTLQKSLHEKELLLKEIHHRVKNNLQIISSLLNLQAEQITDKQMLAIFNDSQSRVRTMALIHEQLYRSFDVGAINLKSYVHYLVQFLERTYHSYNNSVEFCIEVEEFDLSVDLAVPCGLIINELVSNALKYSQGNENICKIALTIFRTFSDKSQIHLVVSDNGLGISDVKIIDNPATLGLQLVQMLTVQLGGNIRIHCGKETKYGGTEISIDFVGN